MQHASWATARPGCNPPTWARPCTGGSGSGLPASAWSIANGSGRPGHSGAFNHWKDQLGGMRRVVEHPVHRRNIACVRLIGNQAASLAVARKAWELAAGDLEPQTMARQKDICRCHHVDLQGIDLTGLEQLRLCQ